MEYTISRTKKNGIILCSSILILHVLISRLLLFLNAPAKINTIETLIRNVIYLVPFGFIMLVFYNYFRHYKLKVLQFLILIIFLMQVILKSTVFTNLLELTWRKATLLGVSTIWIVAIVGLITVLFKNKYEACPAIFSVRNWAISSLLIFAFATTYSFYLKPVNPINTMLLIGLTSAIPYIFTIVFALKLPKVDKELRE